MPKKTFEWLYCCVRVSTKYSHINGGGGLDVVNPNCFIFRRIKLDFRQADHIFINIILRKNMGMIAYLKGGQLL